MPFESLRFFFSFFLKFRNVIIIGAKKGKGRKKCEVCEIYEAISILIYLKFTFIMVFFSDALSFPRFFGYYNRGNKLSVNTFFL